MRIQSAKIPFVNVLWNSRILMEHAKQVNDTEKRLHLSLYSVLLIVFAFLSMSLMADNS